MQVHDELVFEVEKNEVDTLKKEIARIMSASADLAVPLIVDVGTGNTWDDAH